MEKIDIEYLNAQTDETAETPPRNFATVAAVYADGVTLLFDGEDAPSAKHYKTNTSVFFQAGDRVRIFEDSGTYVVEYVVGAPMQAPVVGVPPGGANNTVLTKQSATDYDTGWNVPHYVPTSGTTGHVLTKTNNGYSFQAVPSSLPSGGSTGQVLKKTLSGAAWANETTELPSGGSTGQVLSKTYSGVTWTTPSAQAQSGTVLFRNNGASLGISFNNGSTWYYCLYD